MEKETSTKEHLADILNSHPIIEWAAEKRKELIWGFGFLVLGLLLLVRLSSFFGVKTENNYLQAEKDLALVLESNKTEEQEEALSKLLSILASTPDMGPIYDGTVAQIFLAANKPKEAAPYLEKSLSRTTSQELPHFASFAKASLMIQEGKWDEALKESMDLKAALQTQNDSSLYAFNVLRLALINKHLGKKDGEKAAWKEWQEKKDLPAFQKVSAAFAGVKAPLEEYLKKTGG